MTVRWLPAAEGNLARVHRYLSRFSPANADRIVDEIISRTARPDEFPHLGRAVPEYQLRQLREIIVGEYRVIHLVVAGDVEVHAVIHGAMDLMEDPGEPDA
jgi:plasmid stabilization system protein ParE